MTKESIEGYENGNWSSKTGNLSGGGRGNITLVSEPVILVREVVYKSAPGSGLSYFNNNATSVLDKRISPLAKAVKKATVV